MSNGLDDLSLFDLFRMEAEEQVRLLQADLLQLESGAATAATLESLMRASHSLKGAARIVGLDVIVQLTHVMEDRFVAAQAGSALSPAEVDRMLTATDWLARLQATPDDETAAWLESNTPAITEFASTFSTPPAAAAPVATPGDAPAGSSRRAAKAASKSAKAPAKPRGKRSAAASRDAVPPPAQALAAAPTASATVSESAAEPGRSFVDDLEEDIFAQSSSRERAASDRTVRIGSARFDQILSLASETLVASRTLATQGDVLERNRRALGRAQHLLEDKDAPVAERSNALRELERQLSSLGEHIAELDLVSRANERTAERLYRTVLAGRLRPFSDGVTGVARLVRETARSLGKNVQLEILGESTRVDRDILERLEAPISHLITNAIDHGIESSAERVAAGKPEQASLKLHARHENGRLVITVRDDGHGIDIERVRERVVQRNLASAEIASGLAESELLEFLFLPGFSTRDDVSFTSGRGVGLNVVQSMVQEAGGSVTVSSEPGVGTIFRLTLPVTRSVIKVIRLQAEGEFYAVPLVRIDRVAHLAPMLAPDGAATVEINSGPVPVRVLGELLGLTARALREEPVPMLFSGGLAFAVDRFVDEIEVPVRQLDRRLGKVPGVSAASLDENGLPLLILDIEDLIQTARGRSLTTAAGEGSAAPHILVVDDSHTVREMERRLLVRAGYTVTMAQNGQEAWNLLRLNDYDLLISDVDMPQMNGIELVTKVRDNPRLSRLPVIILSYKNNDEDRRRGLEAGADFYLTKGDFQNDIFRQAVVDLIGEAGPPPEAEAP